MPCRSNKTSKGTARSGDLSQAKQVADYAAFLNTEETDAGAMVGYPAEFGELKSIFESRQHEVIEHFVAGRFA